MPSLGQDERIAALLSALGTELSDPIVAGLPTATRHRVRQALDRYQAAPLDETELEQVLEEFLSFCRAVGPQLPSQPTLRLTIPDEDETDEPDETDETDETEIEGETPRRSTTFTPSEDPFHDLRRLKDFQLAGALQGEKPRTMALVLNCLLPVQAGAALQKLPSELRSQVFLELRNQPTAPPALLERIVRTTVNKGCRLEPETSVDPAEQSLRRQAELLRAMEQQQRGEMLKLLEQQDPEGAERVKSMLFVFEDLVRLTDRSVQRILSEIDSASLAQALKDVDSTLLDKVMANLSKRARATLAEELEFQTQVKPADQQAARKAICEIMARLDEMGQLQME